MYSLTSTCCDHVCAQFFCLRLQCNTRAQEKLQKRLVCHSPPPPQKHTLSPRTHSKKDPIAISREQTASAGTVPIKMCAPCSQFPSRTSRHVRYAPLVCAAQYRHGKKLFFPYRIWLSRKEHLYHQVSLSVGIQLVRFTRLRMKKSWLVSCEVTWYWLCLQGLRASHLAHNSDACSRSGKPLPLSRHLPRMVCCSHDSYPKLHYCL